MENYPERTPICEANHAFGCGRGYLWRLQPPKVDSMLFLAVISRISRPRESESNDLLALSRVGHAGLTVITLVYLLLVLWQR
jgi:hypothetical protein